MRKRLRKKKRMGEFQELGFSVTFRFSKDLSIEESNKLNDDFIGKAIEQNGLVCGGGSTDNEWEVFVTLDEPRGSTTEQHRHAVENWLSNDSRITEYEVGPLVDAWYGHDI